MLGMQTELIVICFWLAVGLLIYPYLGYPLLVFLLTKVWSNSVESKDYTPNVSVLIAAYNEEHDIAATISNKLGLDYPADRIEVIVVSDASTDATEDIARNLAKDNKGHLKVLIQRPRQGKTAALNMASSHAKGDIFVFSDANSIYAKDALTRMMRNFADPSVGYVTGRMVYTHESGSSLGVESNMYMRYEDLLRRSETRLGSVVGVDGGIDAVRSNLYETMRPDQLPDFVLPLSVVKCGYRVVYEPTAVLQEVALKKALDEYRMRVRVTLRALWAMYDMSSLFNVKRYGLYSWQLISHKLLRYTAFVPLFLLLPLNGLLWDQGPIYRLALVGQGVFYGLALFGKLIEGMRIRLHLPRLAYYFLVLNIACAIACVKFAKGEKQIIWSPRIG